VEVTGLFFRSAKPRAAQLVARRRGWNRRREDGGAADSSVPAPQRNVQASQKRTRVRFHLQLQMNGTVDIKASRRGRNCRR